MTIATLDGLVQGLASGPKFPINKASQTAEGAGTFHSLWKAAGMPGVGATPPGRTAGAGYVPTNATAGAFTLANATSPAKNYFGRFGCSSSVAGVVILYDRLWACSAFDTTSVATQSVTSPGSLPAARDPSLGADVEPWLEVYTAPGATGATWTLTGVDAAGNSGRTWTYTHPANAESIGQMMPFVQGTAAVPGCRQVTSMICSISSGTAGDVGITLLRRYPQCVVPLANLGTSAAATELGLQEIYDGAALSLMVMCTTTSTGIVFGDLGVAQA